MAGTLRSQCRRPWFDAWSGNSIPHVATSLYATSKNILSAATRTEDPTCGEEDPAQPNKYINIFFFKKEEDSDPAQSCLLTFPFTGVTSPENLLSSDPHCLLSREANVRQATTGDFLFESY